MARPRPPLRLIEGGPAAAPPGLARAIEFAALGLGLTLVTTLLARLPSWFHELGRFQGLFALAFAFYAIALWRLPRYASLPRVGLVVFAVALATRAALLPLPPSLSGDLYRYLWEGKVVLAGGNPYRQAPDDPALARLRDEVVFPQVNHRELATIYPPAAEAGFALVTRLRPTVAAFKTWVVVHDLALVAVLMAWLASEGASPVGAVVYAWNPLVLVEYAGTGHNDPTALLWLVVALWLARRRPVVSALALSLGALTKLAPLVALPFLLREWSARARWTALAVLAPALAWFAYQAHGATSGLLAYGRTWRNNESLFWLLDRIARDGVAARGLAALAVAVVAAVVWWRRRALAEAARRTFQAAIVATPVMHPWYLGWVLCLEPWRRSAPWLLLSFTAILDYGVLARPAEGRDFHLGLAGRVVEYGLPLALAVVIALRRRRARREER